MQELLPSGCRGAPCERRWMIWSTASPPEEGVLSKVVDSTLAELAASGARTIVQLMATDAWGSAKKLVARVFASRPDSAQREIDADLENSRKRITAEDIVSPEVEEYEQDKWEAVLRLRLLEEPIVAEFIAEILEVARSGGTSKAGDTAAVVMKAEARDNARVYQQGSGIQHNG
jgi:hypothetical protein